MNRFYERTELAENYLKYRPTYTREIAERVIEYYRENHTHQEKIDLMLDVGCGSGQCANIFQSYCNKIIACDVSPEQIKQAKAQNEYDHIQYIEGQAENIELEDNSVDLVVSGIAAHYFDRPKFFQEVKRVLKPSGCLAILGYRMPQISLLGSTDMHAGRCGSWLLLSLLAYATIECPVNLSALVSLQNDYDDIFKALPFEQKKHFNAIHSVSTASINDICGFIRSINVWKDSLNRRIEELKSINIPLTQELIDVFDIAARFKTAIKEFWGLNVVSDDEKIFEVDHQFFVLMATCPEI